MEIALAKITARQNQEPAKTRSLLQPNTSWEPGIALPCHALLPWHKLSRTWHPEQHCLAMPRAGQTREKLRFGPNSAMAHGRGVHCHVLPQAAQHSQQRHSTSPDFRPQQGCPVCAEPLGWFWCPAVTEGLCCPARPCLVPLLFSAVDTTASQDRSPR